MRGVLTGGSEDAIGAPARTGETAVAAVQAVTVVTDNVVAGGQGSQHKCRARAHTPRRSPGMRPARQWNTASVVVRWQASSMLGQVVTAPSANSSVGHAF